MSIQKRLDSILKDFRKVFGSSSIYGANEDFCAPVQSISTGSLLLDEAIGVGGVPRGRIVHIAGKESSGKTLLALEIIKQAQKEGGLAYFIDAEFALDKTWLTSLGVDLNRLLISQPSSAVQAFELLIGKRKSGIPGILERQEFLDSGLSVVVLDSVAALVPPEEERSDVGKSTIALLARFLSPTLRILTPLLAKTNVCFIVINQVRVDPNVMFGNPERSPGGRALKHACAVMLNVASVSKTEILENDFHVGHKIRVKVEKNKVAPPGGSAEVTVHVLKGIDIRDELVPYAIKKNIIKKESERIYIYKNYRWNGLTEANNEVFKNNMLAKELLQDIKEYREKEKKIRETQSNWIEEESTTMSDFVKENFSAEEEETFNSEEESIENADVNQAEDIDQAIEKENKQLEEIIENSDSEETVTQDFTSFSRDDIIQELKKKGVKRYLGNMSKKELISLLQKTNNQ